MWKTYNNHDLFFYLGVQVSTLEIINASCYFLALWGHGYTGNAAVFIKTDQVRMLCFTVKHSVSSRKRFCKHVYFTAPDMRIRCTFLIIPSCHISWLWWALSERAPHLLLICLLTPAVNSAWQLLSKHRSSYFDAKATPASLQSDLVPAKHTHCALCIVSIEYNCGV